MFKKVFAVMLIVCLLLGVNAQAAGGSSSVILTVTDPSGSGSSPDKPNKPDDSGGNKPGNKPNKPSKPNRPNRPGGSNRPGSTPKENPSGGSDITGNPYKLQPGIKTNKGNVENGYIVGYVNHTYGASDNLTRAQFATILSRVFDFDQTSYTKEFVDTRGHWAEAAISKMASRKIVVGVSNTQFMPDAPITRGQVLLMLSRLLDISSYSSVSTIVGVQKYPASTTISRLINSGIYSDIDKNYDPGTYITRGEMAHLINNVIYARNPDISMKELWAKQNDVFRDLTGNPKQIYYKDCLKALNIAGVVLP